MPTLYTVYRCQSKKSNKRKGHTHFSDDADSTLCGKIINEDWFICDNTFTGDATCPKCVTIDKTTIIPQRANPKYHAWRSRGAMPELGGLGCSNQSLS